LKFETSGVFLAEEIGVVNNAKACILNNTDNQGKIIQKKLKTFHQKNKNLVPI